MLGSTKRLLNTARIYFDELGYSFHTTDNENVFDRLLDATFNTINHTKTFKDAIEAIKMFQYLDKHFNKIINAAYKYPEYFDSLEYGENEAISLMDDEESAGLYHVTNAIFGKWSEVGVLSVAYDGPFTFVYDDSRFSVYQDDPKYFLKYSVMSKEKMVLLDKNDEKLCIIKLNKNLEIELNNNHTNYEVDNQDGVSFFYRKGERQKSEDNYDAVMSWDIIDKNSKLGLARIQLYEDECDEELIFLFAAACLLIYRGMVETHHVALTSTVVVSNTFRH